VSGSIPAVEYAIVGGSATVNCRLPEDAQVTGVEVLERDLRFETPFGETQAFKLVRFSAAECDEGREHLALAIRMHGWTTGENWAASRGQQQVFWTLEQAGVRKVVGNAGVGAVNALLDPGDLVVADDVLDQTHSRPSALHATWPNSVNSLEPFCGGLRAGLVDAARGLFNRVFLRGVMATVEGPWLEGVTQVRGIRTLGADLVAHSTVPEVYFAREIGACYATAFLVVDHANGIGPGFDRELMIRTYRDGAVPVAKLMLRALMRAGQRECNCAKYRNPLPLNWDEPTAR
jgi:5'-methylthioadenosine phosphorylase